MRLFLKPLRRARCVPEEAAKQGEQRSLLDKLIRPPIGEQTACASVPVYISSVVLIRV